MLVVFIVALILFTLGLSILVLSINFASDTMEYDTNFHVRFVQHMGHPGRKTFRAKFPGFVSDPENPETPYCISAGPYSYWLNKIPNEMYFYRDGVANNDPERMNFGQVTVPIDVRMFQFNEKLWALAFRARHMELIDLSNNPLQDPVPLFYENQSKTEKNWVAFVQDSQLYFVTRVIPLKIVRCNVTTGKCIVVHDDAPQGFDWDDSVCFIRGCTRLVPTHIPNIQIAVAHTGGKVAVKKRWYDLHTYRCVLILIDTLNYKLMHVSLPINFSQDYKLALHIRPSSFIRVHFASSLCWKTDDELYVGVDMFDSVPMLFTITGVKQWIDNRPTNPPLAQVKEVVSKPGIDTTKALVLPSSWFSWLRAKSYILEL